MAALTTCSSPGGLRLEIFVEITGLLIVRQQL